MAAAGGGGMGGMQEADVLFQNDDVCIVRPDSPRGILIFTHSSSKNICSEGLLSYNELRKRHPELGLEDRSKAHADPKHDDLIFFRAPYNADTSTFESSYNGISLSNMLSKDDSDAYAVIRVDPEKTFVYLSEARAHGTYDNIKNSRMLLSKYLIKISFIKAWGKGVFNYIYTEDKKLSQQLLGHLYNYDTIGNRIYEVVVDLPHIPPDWFVECVYNNIPEKNLRWKKSAPSSLSGAKPTIKYKPIWKKKYFW